MQDKIAPQYEEALKSTVATNICPVCGGILPEKFDPEMLPGYKQDKMNSVIDYLKEQFSSIKTEGELKNLLAEALNTRFQGTNNARR